MDEAYERIPVGEGIKERMARGVQLKADNTPSCIDMDFFKHSIKKSHKISSATVYKPKSLLDKLFYRWGYVKL